MIEKDPNAELDYGLNWSPDRTPWLEENEVITSSVWIVPAGLTLLAESHTDQTATIWLAGGLLGEKYVVTNRIVTNQNRKDDRSLCIQMIKR